MRLGQLLAPVLTCVTFAATTGCAGSSTGQSTVVPASGVAPAANTSQGQSANMEQYSGTSQSQPQPAPAPAPTQDAATQAELAQQAAAQATLTAKQQQLATDEQQLAATQAQTQLNADLQMCMLTANQMNARNSSYQTAVQMNNMQMLAPYLIAVCPNLCPKLYPAGTDCATTVMTTQLTSQSMGVLQQLFVPRGYSAGAAAESGGGE